jgi:hypothetical protein
MGVNILVEGTGGVGFVHFGADRVLVALGALQVSNITWHGIGPTSQLDIDWRLDDYDGTIGKDRWRNQYEQNHDREWW